MPSTVQSSLLWLILVTCWSDYVIFCPRGVSERIGRIAYPTRVRSRIAKIFQRIVQVLLSTVPTVDWALLGSGESNKG